MLWLLATAAAAATAQPTQQAQQPQAAAAVVQAKASIRILSAVRVSLSEDGTSDESAPEPQDTTVRSAGDMQPARLVEFE